MNEATDTAAESRPEFQMPEECRQFLSKVREAGFEPHTSVWWEVHYEPRLIEISVSITIGGENGPMKKLHYDVLGPAMSQALNNRDEFEMWSGHGVGDVTTNILWKLSYPPRDPAELVLTTGPK